MIEVCLDCVSSAFVHVPSVVLSLDVPISGRCLSSVATHDPNAITFTNSTEGPNRKQYKHHRQYLFNTIVSNIREHSPRHSM